jgi:plasmid stability protein
MATLHVRNVPDELYERLRAAAEEDGRSIGAQATMLLRGALAERAHRKQGVGRVVASASPFKQRFAKTAKQVVVRAQELARENGAAETMPAHVLLAMLEDAVLRPALERGGVTDESVHAALPPAAKPGTTAPPLSPQARQMVEQALLASLDASV